jgi:hypothetical protein
MYTFYNPPMQRYSHLGFTFRGQVAMECTHATLTHVKAMMNWPHAGSRAQTVRRLDTILTHPHMRDTMAMFFFFNWHYMDMIRVMIGYWDVFFLMGGLWYRAYVLGLYWDHVLGITLEMWGISCGCSMGIDWCSQSRDIQWVYNQKRAIYIYCIYTIWLLVTVRHGKSTHFLRMVNHLIR